MMRRLTKHVERTPRRGMILVQVAVALSLLMTVLAVTVDLGLLLVERRHAQATADAAALAAASDLYAKWNSNQGADTSGSAKSSALGVASANGYTNDATTSSVTVNIPPLAGNFIGVAGYAEVIVTYYQKRGFSGVLGSGTLPVSGRAVAQGRSVTSGSASPAILLLGTGTNITDNGSNSLVSVAAGSGGAIFLDGSATLHGSGASVTAPYVYTTASSLPSGVTSSIATFTSQPLMADPLGYLPDPPTSSNAGSGVTVDSTTYAGGMSGTVTLNPTAPTIYIVGGSGIGKVTLTEAAGNTNGVMIYLSGTSAGVNLTGQSSVNLPNALTTGTYLGMSIFQARDDSTGWSVKGNASLNVGGTIYAPAADVVAAGNGTGGIGSQIIANAMTMDGNGNTISYGSGTGNHTPSRAFGLVE
jgi:Flp pilus assembly protein TadG